MSVAPLGIIAGLGDLPFEVARSVESSGRPVFVIRIRGFEEPRLERFRGAVLSAGEIGRQFQHLKDAGCQDVTFAGVVRRVDIDDLVLDERGAELLPVIMGAGRDGDDALLRRIAEIFEHEGFTVIAPDQVARGLIAPAGLLAGPEPSDEARSDLAAAARIARVIGAYDIGQGCIVCRGLTLAVEAQEGTDAMLRRVAALPNAIRGGKDGPAGVLVKRAKPGQDRRIDLPVVGPATIRGAANAGLAGVGVEAGGALIVDREATSAAAATTGVFLIGLSLDDDE